MVRVVPGVPDRDILEQTSVRPQNLASPGPHHLSLPPHVPRPSVPIPSSPLRHEMLRHVHQPRCCKIRRDILHPPISSGSMMSTLKSPATINSAPGGFRPIAATTVSMVTLSSGETYAPTMCQRLSPVATWNTITLCPHLSTASTTKWGVGR